MDFTKLWSYETCHPAYREKWNIRRPAIGQCLVTSLVIQDLFGGKIANCKVGRCSHFINIINNKIVDLTKEQFDGMIEYKQIKERDRNELLKNKNTMRRYLIIKEKLGRSNLCKAKKDWLQEFVQDLKK